MESNGNLTKTQQGRRQHSTAMWGVRRVLFFKVLGNRANKWSSLNFEFRQAALGACLLLLLGGDI
jgi:hypothetical protein